jgi:hypothetical protein
MRARMPGLDHGPGLALTLVRQKIRIERQWKRASEDCRTTVVTGTRSGWARSHVVMSSPRFLRRSIVVAENTLSPS